MYRRLFFQIAVTEDSRLLGRWICVIGFEFTKVSDKPLAFILNVACRTGGLQELVLLALQNDNNMLETLRSVD